MDGCRGRRDTAGVNGGLVAQRVARDIDVVARAGLPVEQFLDEALLSLQRALPHVGACVAHLDPSTHLNTSAHKYGDLRGRDEHDRDWGRLEFGPAEPLAIRHLAQRGVPAVAVQHWNRQAENPTTRLHDFMEPLLGYADELRAVFRDRGEVWGGVSLFRGPDDTPFDEGDVALMTSLSQAFAVGMRGGLLVEQASAAHPPLGPAVLVVDAEDRIRQLSLGAEERLAEIASSSTETATGTVAALVGAARRFAAGSSEVPARARVRAASGLWLVLHANALLGAEGSTGDVVVTIDEARPPEIVPLVVAAFDLTGREREVTLLVLQGVETREIASRLHVSPYTVQDHLKAIFDKAGVRSRRELIARIYFDQYVPRLGTDLGPTGWFASA